MMEAYTFEVRMLSLFSKYPLRLCDLVDHGSCVVIMDVSFAETKVRITMLQSQDRVPKVFG